MKAKIVEVINAKNIEGCDDCPFSTKSVCGLTKQYEPNIYPGLPDGCTLPEHRGKIQSRTTKKWYDIQVFDKRYPGKTCIIAKSEYEANVPKAGVQKIHSDKVSIFKVITSLGDEDEIRR